MFEWFKESSLEKHLNHMEEIRVCGIKFTIRKISPIDYLDGSQVMQRMFDTYTVNKSDDAVPGLMKHLKKHYSDIFMAAVVEPKLTRATPAEEGKIFVENLMTDWELATELYEKIMQLTYGKKNYLLYKSQGKK